MFLVFLKSRGETVWNNRPILPIHPSYCICAALYYKYIACQQMFRKYVVDSLIAMALIYLMKKKDKLLVDVGNAIRARRKAQGMSQEELAHASGINSKYLGGVERGEINSSLLSLKKVTDALDCGLPDILPRGKDEGVNKYLSELIVFLENQDAEFLSIVLPLIRTLRESIR